jgi:hypothetical protein
MIGIDDICAALSFDINKGDTIREVSRRYNLPDSEVRRLLAVARQRYRDRCLKPGLTTGTGSGDMSVARPSISSHNGTRGSGS